ncbi:MAG: protein kinase [Lentilitoribacter sp.]
MQIDKEVWQATSDYSERWIKGKRKGSGGQGHGYQVSRLGSSSPEHYFLKILKDQSNPQRRQRMFREAVALETYDHPRIPQLIESNSQLHDDQKANLYLVTELITGNTLEKSHRQPFSFKDAVDITDQIAETVGYLQVNDAVHRDIKPANIILRDGKIDAVLIDFGLTFNQQDVEKNLTGEWEELGNRFLRLPELASYSEARQDHRTDIAFLSGILFYCLIGEVPAVLEDGAGNLPHQRSGVDLKTVTPDITRARSLARLFDQGFQPRMSDRFPNVAAFRNALANIKETPQQDFGFEDLIKRAGSLGGNGEMAARYRRRTTTLSEIWIWMDKVVRAIQVLTKGTFVLTSSGDYAPGSDQPYRNVGLHHHHRGHLHRYWLKTTCRFIGDDIVVTIAEEDGSQEEEVLRTSVDDPNFHYANERSIQTRLVLGIENLQLS